MILKKLQLINYKNITEAQLELSPKINCLIGHNGAGKTNILDAVYYLSFCRSASNPVDAQVIRHDEDFFVLEGEYVGDGREVIGGGREVIGDGQEAEGNALMISVGMKRGTKKHFRRDKKEYRRLSEHIGLIPLVMISPGDTLLIEGGSEERRRFVDMVISQYDNSYIDHLNRYNKALLQRNIMLKQEEEPDADLLGLWEEQMAAEGEALYAKRKAFIDELTPVFQHYYKTIADSREEVSLRYVSHCQRGPLLDVIKRDRMKDRAVGYSLHGVHRDDLEMLIEGHPMKREGSQGQNKTFVIALKMAEFGFLKHTRANTTPLLLLDDIFDKLDSSRVEQIVGMVSGNEFGQIFITDTNREHLDQILASSSHDYKLFHVEGGEIVVS